MTFNMFQNMLRMNLLISVLTQLAMLATMSTWEV